MSKVAGIVIATSFDGTPSEHDTHQCVHCGMHWIVVKGSKKPHVWCQKCGGWTCSKPLCLTECYPEEKRLDDIEKHGRLILP